MPTRFATRSSSRSMPMRRRPEALASAAVLAAVAIVAAVVAVRDHDHATSPATPASSWRGLVGDVHASVSLGERAIVVLRAPSLADRLAHSSSPAQADERHWTSQAHAAQHAVLARLSKHGFAVRPDFTFVRVLDGFSAPLDPRAVALLDADPAVRGVYPVRAAFPATISARAVRRAAGPLLALPGFDGRGVTIALL